MGFFHQLLRLLGLAPVIAALLGCMATPRAAVADVIVLANRTGALVTAQFLPHAGVPQQLRLNTGEVLPLFQDGIAHVELDQQGTKHRYRLEPNTAHFFGRNQQRQVGLQNIGLGEKKGTSTRRPLPGSAMRTPSATITVKLLVDEDEPTLPQHWQRRLVARIARASEILEKHSRINLKVVAIEAWNSDNSLSDFEDSLEEFEREVKPGPAHVAIGFTSQWPMLKGRVHMAGTRGPLHSHILMRDNAPNLSEPEKLEFLVHELGHFLGAGHSPEKNSVMRPVLGDGQVERAGFRVQFDPVNTLIMSMLGEEIRRRHIRRFREITPATQVRLGQVYTELARTMPKDASLRQHVQVLGGSRAPSGQKQGTSTFPKFDLGPPVQLPAARPKAP